MARWLGTLAGLGLVGFGAGAVGPTDAPPPEETVSAVLDELHASAARADEAIYFALFTEDAVFLGTDPGERWTKAEFEAFAMPYFERDSAWTYEPKVRHVSVRGDVAWFDETLQNAKLGECRGTGVLVRDAGRWRIAQYNLTIPIPNDVTAEVVERIEAFNAREAE